jgi:hypothetical protein
MAPHPESTPDSGCSGALSHHGSGRAPPMSTEGVRFQEESTTHSTDRFWPIANEDSFGSVNQILMR